MPAWYACGVFVLGAEQRGMYSLTDGIIEHRNIEGYMYSEERLIRVLLEQITSGSKDILKGLEHGGKGHRLVLWTWVTVRFTTFLQEAARFKKRSHMFFRDS